MRNVLYYNPEPTISGTGWETTRPLPLCSKTLRMARAPEEHLKQTAYASKDGISP